MSDLKALLDRVVEDFEPVSDGFERTLARIRQRRRHRIGIRAASSFLVVGGLVAVLLIIPGHGDRRITTPPAVPPVTPTVQSVTSLPVPGGLTDVAVGDGSLWVRNTAGVVHRIDATTGRLRHQIPVKGGSDYRYVAVGAGAVWVTDSGTRQVSRIDPHANRVVATITLDGDPTGIKVAAGAVWVTYTRPTSSPGTADTGVVIIDPHTNRADPPIQFSRAGPTQLAVGDGQVWVSDGFTVAYATGHRFHTALHLPGSQLQLVAAGDHALWFIPADRSGFVRLDTTGIPISSSRPGSLTLERIALPQAVRVAVAQNAIWVLTNRNDATGQRPGQLFELDPKTLTTIASPTTVGTTPVQLVAANTAVWVANDTDATITRIALHTGRPTASLEIDALGTLSFDQKSYTVPAGTIQIHYVSKDGPHTLSFDPPGPPINLYVDANATVSTKVQLKRGIYVIFCHLPGHRAAGMQAILIAQ
jgi:streptogramin lyase